MALERVYRAADRRFFVSVEGRATVNGPPAWIAEIKEIRNHELRPVVRQDRRLGIEIAGDSEDDADTRAIRWLERRVGPVEPTDDEVMDGTPVGAGITMPLPPYVALQRRFGSTHCEIRVSQHPLNTEDDPWFLATVKVVLDDRYELVPSDEGEPLSTQGRSASAAVRHIEQEVEHRFGPRGDDPVLRPGARRDL